MKTFFISLCVIGFATGAHAVTIGDVTFNDNAWADTAFVQLGVGRGNAANLGDDDLSTGFQLRNTVDGNATVGFSFSDNTLFNGDGFDLVIFSGVNNNNLHVGRGPNFDFLGNAIGHTDGINTTFGVSVTDPNNPTGFGLSAQQWDLSFFGFADGEEVNEDLFVSMGGIFGTVWGIAALNSKDVVVTPPINPMPTIPLPATGMLLMTALGAFGLSRRRT